MDLEDQLKEALKVDVPPELKLSMRERIMNEARLSQESQDRKRVVATPRGRWHLPFLPKPVRLHPVTFASVVFLSVFAGTAAASGSASPDSLLYPVRQTIEDARISLVRSDVDRARAELELADQRLTEVSDMLREGKDAYVPDLLARYETNMSQAISLRDQAARDDRDVSEIDALAAAIAARHDEILSSALLSEDIGDDSAGAGPAAARPHAGNSSASVSGGTTASTPAAQPAAPAAGAAASGDLNNPPVVVDNQGADAADIEQPEEDDSAQNGSDNDSSDRRHSASRRAERTSAANIGSYSRQKHGDSATHSTDKSRGGASLAARND